MKNPLCIFLLLFIYLIYSENGFSQTGNWCGTDAMHKYLMEHDSAYATRINAINDYSKQFQDYNNNSRILSDTVITIPVVVHVIYTGNDDNPREADIYAMIDELNKTFSATSSYYFNTSNGGIDTKIQFAMAKRTPTCAGTTGIIRVYAGNIPKYVSGGVQFQYFGEYDSTGCGIGISQMLSLSPLWPTTDYYNLYLVRGVCNGAMAFAQFGNYAVCPYNGGALPHETGHYLYLYHTFEGTNGSTCPPNMDCANTGDLVCDTDPETYGSCSSSESNPCTGRSYGNVANNFMSYGCQKKFTNGQKQRMRTAIEGPYSTLSTSLGATPPTVFVNPTISIAQYYGTNPSCSDSIVKFKVTYSTTNLGRNPQLSWYINSNGYYGNTDSLILNNGMYDNNDTVYCSITATNSCVSPNPKFSNKIVVKKYPRVVPTISIALISGTNPSCEGTPMTFTATITHGGTAPKYRWKVNNVIVGTNSNTFTSSSLVNGDYVFCQLVSNENCTTDSLRNSNNIYIQRNLKNKPTVSIALNGSQNPSCVNTALTFKATTTYAGTAPVYQWKINNVNAGTNSPTFTSSAIGNNDSVTCVLTSNENCISTTIAISRAVYINRIPYAAPAVSIAASTTKICQGSSVSFTATPVNNTLPPSFQWKVNNVNVGTNSYYFTTTALNNNDIVQCMTTSNDLCPSFRNANSNSIKITVLPKVVPTLIIQNLTNNDSACIGEIVKLKAIPTNSGTATYSWYITYSSTKDTISDIISVGSKTYYCSILIDTSRYCSNTPIVSATHKVYGEIKPAKPIITQISNYLKSSATTGNQWYSVAAGKITGAINQTFYPTVNGKYFCIITKNRCSSPHSDTITINNITTGIFNNKSNNELPFQIIPNPNSGSFKIVMEDKINGMIEVSVYDVLGQQVYNNNFSYINDKEINLQLPALVNGLYNIIIQKDNKSYSRKIEIIK